MGASEVWTLREAKQWIAAHLWDELGFAAADVDQDASFSSLGLTSQAAAQMVAQLAAHLGPKGVVIEHRAALGTLRDVGRRFGIGAADRVLGLSAMNFDLSVFDVFGVLAAGGALVLREPHEARDPQAWSELVRRHDITVWNSVPALLQMPVDHLQGQNETVPSLRTVMFSGDWIPTDLPERARRCALTAALHSLGGATAIWSIIYPTGDVDRSWSSIPYGMPLENQGFHVLDYADAIAEDAEGREVWIVGWSMGGVAIHTLTATTTQCSSRTVSRHWPRRCMRRGAPRTPGRHPADRTHRNARRIHARKDIIMTDFTRHDVASAPEKARPILENTAKGFGFVPAPVALMAESPELLEGFMSGNALFNQTTLSAMEREVFILTMATTVECHYCVAMHSAMLTRQRADSALIESLRARKPLEDPKLEAMRVFTLAVMEGHGHVDPQVMDAFLGAGYTRRNALEVVLGMGVYTISTYTNRMTEAPVDEPFKAFEWHGER